MWLLASFVVVPTTVVSAVNPNFSSENKTTAFVLVVVGFTMVALLVRKPEKPLAIPASNLFTPCWMSSLVVSVALVSLAAIIFGYGVQS